MIGRLHSLVIDCPDPAELAGFYAGLLGLSPLREEGDWVSLGDQNGREVLALQRVEHFISPQWPDPERPQQLHLDVLVDDLDVAQARVLALGARLLDGSDQPIGYRVYADPVGHPFCLLTPESVPG